MIDESKNIVAASVLSAVLSGMAAVLIEQAMLLLYSPVYFKTESELIWGAFVAAAFFLPLATIGGFAFGLGWRALRERYNPWAYLLEQLKLARENKLADRSLAASLGAAIVTAGFLFFLVRALNSHFGDNYQNRTLASLAATVLLFGLMALSPLFYLALRRAILRRLGPLGDLFPRSLLIVELSLALLAFVVAFAYGIYRYSELLSALNLKPAVLLLSALMLFFVFYRILRHPVWYDFLSSLSRPAPALFWVAIIWMQFGFAFTAFPSQDRVALMMSSYAPGSHYMVRALRSAGDRDGDGFSSWLGGGDCNDANPDVYPLAMEIPGNGLDDDCNGGDAPKLSEESRKKDKDSELDSMLQMRIDSLADDYNIFIISLDAWRADRAGFLGAKRDLTPNIDKLAEESLVFKRAYVAGPTTPQSMPSLVTGKYPSQIRWDKYTNFPKIQSETRTIFQEFADAGYYVGGVFSHWYFSNRNFDRGASHWDNRAFRENGHSELHTTSHLLTDHAIEHLSRMEKRRRKVCMWIHYFDIHWLYLRHSEFDFGNGTQDRYDSEVAYTDHHIGRLLDYLRQSPYWEKAVVIITSDHGEEFEEHGRKFHGSQVYEESIHVPLLIRLPLIAHKEIDTPVSQVDLAPTLFDLTGLEKTRLPLQGNSLLPLILQGPQNYRHPVFTEKLKSPVFPWSMQSFISDPWKLLYRPEENLYELYNLQKDPKEKNNLINDLPEFSFEMKRRMADFKQHTLTSPGGWYKMAAGR